MLDPSGRAEVLQAAQALHRDGVTIVASTHFMNEVALADRVIVLAEGRVAMEGAPRDLFAQPERLRELELDVPQVTEIAARLRARGVDVGLVPITVAELADAYVRVAR
jgi:energy-coupling factor transport system ATP-binding protein